MPNGTQSRENVINSDGNPISMDLVKFAMEVAFDSLRKSQEDFEKLKEFLNQIPKVVPKAKRVKRATTMESRGVASSEDLQKSVAAVKRKAEEPVAAVAPPAKFIKTDSATGRSSEFHEMKEDGLPIEPHISVQDLPETPENVESSNPQPVLDLDDAIDDFLQTSAKTPSDIDSSCKFFQYMEQIRRASSSQAIEHDELNQKLRRPFAFLEQIFRRRFPACNLYVFGSMVQCLASPSSDLDLYLNLGPGNEPPKCGPSRKMRNRDWSQWLRMVAKVLTGSGIGPLEVVAAAKVPVIRFHGGNPSFDISFHEDGLRTSHFVRRYVVANINVLQPYLLALIEWAKANGAHGADRQLLNTYSLVLMALYRAIRVKVIRRIRTMDGTNLSSILDSHAPEPFPLAMKAPNPVSSRVVAALLLDFFTFYGSTFAANEVMVQLRNPRHTEYIPSEWSSLPLVVKDPCNDENCTTRSVIRKNWLLIRSKFINAALLQRKILLSTGS